MFAGLRVCSVRGDYFFSNFRNEQKNKLFPSYQENDAVFVLVDLLAVSRVEEQVWNKKRRIRFSIWLLEQFPSRSKH